MAFTFMNHQQSGARLVIVDDLMAASMTHASYHQDDYTSKGIMATIMPKTETLLSCFKQVGRSNSPYTDKSAS
jgi:hypothetical protein